jgi:hypothetical protein
MGPPAVAGRVARRTVEALLADEAPSLCTMVDLVAGAADAWFNPR